MRKIILFLVVTFFVAATANAEVLVRRYPSNTPVKVAELSDVGSVEGTAVLSTGETGATKYLREDGDDTSSWQTVNAVDVSITDAGSKIIATKVEGALQENRTAIDLNTAHKSSDGSDHSFIDQDVTSGSSPTLDAANITGVVSGTVDTIHIDVKKGSVGTIAKGLPVYISGYNASGFIEVELADATDSTTMPAIGIANEEISNSVLAKVISNGNIVGFDTSAFAVEDPIYISNTGTLTATKPTGTDLIQKVGIILRSHATLGAMQVVGAGRTNDVPNIAEGYVWKGNASGVATAYDLDTALAGYADGGIEFVIDGGGSAITTGVKYYLEVPFACTISGVTLLADQSGSIVLDIWKDTYANYPPTVADTITSAAKPTISSAIKSQDLTLTGWTVTVAKGDILGINVDSAATIEICTVSLRTDR